MAAATTEALPTTNELTGPLKPLEDSVPNHLTETRIFTHVHDQHSLKVRPRSIHFEGYKVGKLHQQTLTLVNGSGDGLSFHFIPPTTRFFKISYTKQRTRLMSGLSLAVNVQFKPEQWKYYYDCIRVHCKGDENVLIPIHGYPSMDTSTFPRSITFQPTPIGQTKTHPLTLRTDIPVDFEYELTYEQTHPSFTVAPMKGIVPGSGTTVITVAFTPTEFSTAIIKLKLEISQFNSKPSFCTITGTSAPGLAVMEYTEQFHKERQRVAKTTGIKTVLLSSRPVKKPWKKRSSASSSKKERNDDDSSSEEVVYEGIVFPSNLYTPSAMAKVLSQEPGKMSASQLRKVRSVGGQSGGNNSRQLKEAVFLERVRERAELEAKNKIRWVKNIGNDPMDEEQKKEVWQSREQSERMYKIKRNVIDSESCSAQKTTVYNTRRRTWRNVQIFNEGNKERPSFDKHLNDVWETRCRGIRRFINAVRTVMLRNRCEQRLKLLRELIRSYKVGGGGARQVNESTSNTSCSNGHASYSLQWKKLALTLDQLLPPSLPQYADKSTTNTSGTAATTALTNTPVPTSPLQVNINPKISLMELKVPQQYKILGYTRLLVPSRDSYTLPDINISDRPLLTGAEDEYKGLVPIPGVDPKFLSDDFSKQESVKHLTDDVILEDMEGTGVAPLVPPPLMFTEPLLTQEIHNPSPGVIDGLRPMIPNSEVTFEHVLLPLPSPTAAPYPQPLIDPEDCVPGRLMNWKQLYSPFLSTHEERSDLVSSWKPVLSDPFMNDLLPLMTHPHQLNCPQEDDLVDHSVENIPVLRGEMLRRDFHIPVPTDTTAIQSICDRRKVQEEVLLCGYQETLNTAGRTHEEKYRQFIEMLTPSSAGPTTIN